MQFIHMLPAVALILAGIVSAPLAAQQDPVVIRNVTVIDAVDGARANQTVVLQNGRIVSVSPDQAQAPADATIVDGTDKYLIPGLWDAHVHLAYYPDVSWQQFYPLALAHGVTYLRDTGGHLDKLAEARAKEAEGMTPDLFVAGPLIDGVPRVYDGSPGRPDLSVGVATPEAAAAMVDELEAEGVAFVKAYEMLSPEAFAAVIERAHALNLKVAAHSPLQMGALETALSGVNDLQHLRNLELDCAQDPSGLLAERREAFEHYADMAGGDLRAELHRHQRSAALASQDAANCEALIAALAENKVYQTPTLTVTRFSDARLFTRDDVQQTYAYMGPAVAERWNAAARRIAARPTDPIMLAYGNWANGMLKRLETADVPIMAGTDAPIGFLTPGASLLSELELMAEAGLDPRTILAAATITPARFFGMEDEQGSIAAGMRADLVLLRANPLDFVGNYRAINMVIKDGVIHDRAALDFMLAQSAAGQSEPASQ